MAGGKRGSSAPEAAGALIASIAARSHRRAVALLVLLAAAARTRVVAIDLRHGRGPGLRGRRSARTRLRPAHGVEGGRGGRPARRHARGQDLLLGLDLLGGGLARVARERRARVGREAPLRRLTSGAVARERRRRVGPARGTRPRAGAAGAGRAARRGTALHANAQRETRDLVLDRDHELLEQLEAFGLVLVLRILLRVAAKADAVAQGVDRAQVVHPLRVDRVQEQVAVDAALELGAELLLALLVARQHDRDGGLRIGLLGRGRARGALLELDPEETLEPVAELLGVALERRRLALHDVLGHRHDLLAQLLVLEDLLAHAVDGLALLVHHLVVLEQRLAHLEVVVLD